MVLDFKGRHILSSAKNFQLALPSNPETRRMTVLSEVAKAGTCSLSVPGSVFHKLHVLRLSLRLRYGKIGPQTFSLDFKCAFASQFNWLIVRYPLSVIQAFGTSLTTLFWT